MWVSVREGGVGLADPVGVFMSGAQVGGKIGSTRGGSFPLALLEKGNDYSLMGKRIERLLLSRGNTGSSLAKDIGVQVLAFPHLKPTTTTWSERVEGELRRVTRRRSSLIAARRVAGGSGA